MEEEFEDVTIEEAIAEFEFPELEERIKKAFPDPYTEFDVNELLECIFIKRTSYIWILEADERQERFLSVSMPFVSMPFNDDVYEVSETIECKYDYPVWSEVYHKRTILFWEYQSERVYTPLKMVNDWIEKYLR